MAEMPGTPNLIPAWVVVSGTEYKVRNYGRWLNNSNVMVNVTNLVN